MTSSISGMTAEFRYNDKRKGTLECFIVEHEVCMQGKVSMESAPKPFSGGDGDRDGDASVCRLPRFDYTQCFQRHLIINAY